MIHLFEVYYGSTQLEYIREYAPFVSVLMDSHASTDRLIKMENNLEGMHLSDARTGITIAAEGSNTFCIPVVSGIIGSLAEKMLPVGSLTRDNLMISITLPDQIDLITQVVTTVREVSKL